GGGGEGRVGKVGGREGRLVGGVGDGGRVSASTLARLGAYLADHPVAGLDGSRFPTPPSDDARGTRADTEIGPRRNFRFFDNRQKYLLFVTTCSEKTVVANRVALELGSLRPTPPAMRVFDAGIGDGTVLARVMRAMHAPF